MENENRLVKAKEVEEIFNYEVSVAEKDPLDAFDSAILNAATVDAREVVDAYWVNVIHAVVDTTGYCTNCNKKAVWRTRDKTYDICPHCGATMKGIMNGTAQIQSNSYRC